MRHKLHLVVGQASHFVAWERAVLSRHFDLISQPSTEAVLLAFGPDVLDAAANLPALRRVAMLFPGFGCNPYHDLEYRHGVLRTIQDRYDLLFINPGPLEVAYRECQKLVVCEFSV